MVFNDESGGRWIQSGGEIVRRNFRYESEFSFRINRIVNQIKSKIIKYSFWKFSNSQNSDSDRKVQPARLLMKGRMAHFNFRIGSILKYFEFTKTTNLNQRANPFLPLIRCTKKNKQQPAKLSLQHHSVSDQKLGLRY